LEKIKKVKEFTGEEKISNHVDTILIAKFLQNTLWHGFKMSLLKIPIEEWHDSMSPRCPYEIRPIDITLSKPSNSRSLFRATEGSSTA
jgi:hypothetical protein